MFRGKTLIAVTLGFGMLTPAWAQEEAPPPQTEAESAPAASAEAPPPESAEIPVSIPVAEVRESAPPPLEQKEEAHTRLDDVVVTATKREKSLREIPASIAALDGRDLEAKGILSVNEILEQTPGVSGNSVRPGDQRVIMRGISTNASPTSSTPYPVGIFIGDTAFNEPYAASITPDLSAFDLQGIEILKGPQGTLFGGAALSGAIRYRLNDPEPGLFQVRGFSQYTSLTDGEAANTYGAAINLPLFGEGGELGLRLGYINRRYPGLYDDARPEQAQEDANAARGEQFRAGLMWKPQDEWHLKLSYLFQDYDAPNDLIISDSTEPPRQTRGTLLPWINQHQFSFYNLEFQYDFDSMRLVSSSSRTEKQRYNNIDSVGAILGPPPAGTPEALALPYVTENASWSFQQELRLQSTDDGPLEWLVGGYYYYSPIHYFLSLNAKALSDAGNSVAAAAEALETVNSLLGGLIGENNPLTQLLGQLTPQLAELSCELYVLCAETNAIAKEMAFFADLTWEPWEFLELSGGARFYRTQVDGGFIGRGVAARVVNNGMSPADFRARIEEQGVSPKVSATVKFTDDISLYALASKGFRFGGIQNIPEDEVQNVPATYKSDSLWNYELGLRTSWLDRTLQFDVTGFHIDYKNPLVTLKNLIMINYYDNVGAAASNGFEASLRWLTPIPGVLFSAGGGTVHAYTTEPFQAGNTDVPAGRPLPGSAKLQYNGQLTLIGPPGWWLGFGANLGYAYVGEANNDLVSDNKVGDFGVWNASVQASLNEVAGKPTFSLAVNNIANETAVIGIIGSTTGSNFNMLNPPRTIVARIGVEFE